MSGGSGVAERFDRERLLAALFGDRRGFALFLGAAAFLLVVTRVGVFITDTYTTANAFVALTRGRLAVEAPYYGTSLNTPGIVTVDGVHYGRNYGQLVASLPAYVLVRGVALVADLRIALAAAWSLCLLGLSGQVGHLLDQYRSFALGGAVVALLAFAGNVAVATDLSPALHHILAMQITSILAGALLVVVVYRLAALLRTRRAGLLAGVIVLFGTPVAFWSPIPKRHVFTSLLFVSAAYGLARSRTGDPRSRTVAHAGAYVSAALLAWIHAPEALVLFVALITTDAVTLWAGRGAPLPGVDRRRVLAVGCAFVAALVPFFVTNVLISGNPLLPPRLFGANVGLRVVGPGLLPAVGPVLAGLTTAGFVPLAIPVVEEVVVVVETFAALLWNGLVTLVTDPDQVYHTFVRSGYVETYTSRPGQAFNLAVLESAPTLAAAVALPFAGVIGIRGGQWGDRDWLDTPGGVTAVAVGGSASLLTLLYVSRLPLPAQVTVRYLLPVSVLGVVAIVLLGPVGRALRSHVRTFAWSLAGGVLVGGQLMAVVVVGLEMAIGEAFQFHALAGLAVGVVLAVWALVGTQSERFDRTGAALVGLAVAAAAVFTLSVVVVFADDIGRYPNGGEHALGLVRVLSELLTRV